MLPESADIKISVNLPDFAAQDLGSLNIQFGKCRDVNPNASILGPDKKKKGRNEIYL